MSNLLSKSATRKMMVPSPAPRLPCKGRYYAKGGGVRRVGRSGVPLLMKVQ